jgi:hypothetical protein
MCGPVLGALLDRPRCWACRLIEAGCAALDLECRLIPERHTEDAYDTCFAEVPVLRSGM